ncbi:MAG: LPS export ABC transporter permease LptF [Marinosulfonomonas sp.]|nr:LPS export ABC transporter permease LptF [Marinosulfonomonas sp.]
MAKFDRYILSQLMVLFGFFSLVLVLVYWVNRAVVLFDQLIANGQSAMVFLEFTALTLPNVIRLVLPIAAFAAVVNCTNRLSLESELVVVQATGFSPFRLARPVLIFGALVGIFLSVLTHFLVPASLAQLSERSVEIQRNMTARLLQEGTFLHPAKGITFYIRDITTRGELRDVFLSDRRKPQSSVNYSASRALLISEEGGAKLVMFDGMAQALQTEGQLLSTTSFKDFVFNIGSLIGQRGAQRPKIQELPTNQLLAPTDSLLSETRSSRAAFLQKGHERISQALLCIVASLIGFSALMMGGFSRFGLWRQILLAVFMLILVKSLDNYANGAAYKNAALWPLVYLSSFVGFLVGAAMLWASARPGLFSRRRNRAPQ